MGEDGDGPHGEGVTGRAFAPRRRQRDAWRQPETVRIDDLSHDGRGVAHIDGKAVFVSCALPGELVRIARDRRRRRHDEAQLLEVLEASDDRVDARCAHFDKCGGCSLQHLPSKVQIAAKQKVLLENLARIGQVEPEQILAPLTADSWAYRRRARLAVRHVRAKGRVLVGFRERLSAKIAEMHQCEILAPPVGQLLDPLSALIGELDVRERIAQIEVAVGESSTVLVLRNLDPLGAADVAKLRQFAASERIVFCLQPAGPDSIVDLDGHQPSPLHYTLPAFDVVIAFLPSDFVQINGELNARMVERAIELLALDGRERVLDLFAGVGNFTLPLARRAQHVVAVEGDGALVQRLRDNAQANGLGEKVQAHVGDLSADISPYPWAKARYDAVLLDPSRAGADAAMTRIPRWQPKRICYISCHPGTLARDAGSLVRQHGYRLRQAGVMDMFPHTGHVESIALFERNA